jgi:hypothetical protein
MARPSYSRLLGAAVQEEEHPMSRFMRAAVLVTGLMSLFGVMSATAGAVTWHNTGSTAFTVTAGARTLSSTGANFTCTGATATGDAPTGSAVGVTYTVRGTLTYNGCSLSGITTAIECGYAFTGTSQSGSVTSGALDVTCSWYQFGSKLCHEGGSVTATYTNPVSGVGTLTLVTGGNLIVTNGPTGSCPLGNGDRAHLSELTFRTTSASPPVITRTA